MLDDGIILTTSSSYVPAAQAVQEVAPGAAYVPDAHAVHGVPASPSTSAYPAAQSTQPRVEASVKEPGAEYVPAKQLVHGVDALLSSSCVPAAHSVHSSDPTDEKKPDRHTSHDALPTLSW